MQTSNASNNQNDFVISYLLLRQLIGILGISLPFVLVIGNLLLGACTHVQLSISHYYYSYLHIVFVGTLCVLGGFLISYRGSNNYENRVSNFAGFFAFGVAVFPTTEYDFTGGAGCKFLTVIPPLSPIVSKIHFGCAALLFVCFIIFCLKIFQQPDENKAIDQMKRRRNAVYKFCGWGIAISIGCIAIITVYNAVFKTNIFPYSTLVFETSSLLFFGFSWLLKGSLHWPQSNSKIKRSVIQYFRN